MIADEETILLIKRTFKARAEDVFDAWLTRERWQAWIGPEGMDCKVTLLEPRVGGRYRVDMRGPDGSLIPVSGQFKVIDRPRTLSFTWGWDGDPTRQSLITLQFIEVNGTTEFTLRQEGLQTVENRRQHEHGWNGALAKLERYLG
ncbi:MAG: SRPBCC domain-containing protein [Hyphomicrobiales bacterium]|nr:SRPBCC domain-containing protein [Hyphomicrobiales bacterium]MBV9910017.1 SRPBCC domain-containing protein [Hyphomicrobiales bacterium]